MKQNKIYPPEDVLIKQCLRSNRKAQKALYDRYAKAMYHTIFRLVPYGPEAEDILQDSFVKVFAQLSGFQQKSSLGLWIKKICINTSLKHLRKHKNISFLSEEHVPEENTEIKKECLSIDLIHQKVKQLPEGCRVVFSMYAFEELKHQEIAKLLNISESTSKTQYRRAKQILAEKLKEAYYA